MFAVIGLCFGIFVFLNVSFSGSVIVDTGICFSNMKSPSHGCFKMTSWPSTSYSYFHTNHTFHKFHGLDTELDPHRIASGFHGSFATGVACQPGTLTLPDTWFRSFWDLLMLQLLRPDFSSFSCLFSTFHLEYPSVLPRFCFTFFCHLWGEVQVWLWRRHLILGIYVIDRWLWQFFNVSYVECIHWTLLFSC